MANNKISLKNTPKSYGLITIANHWLSAIIFIGLITIGLIMSDMEDGDQKFSLYALHKSMGITIFMLVAMRFVWLKISPNPKQLSKNKFEHILAHAVKGVLYLAMLGMPLSGWIMSNSGGYEVAFFNLFVLPNIVAENDTVHELFKTLHGTFGQIMIAIVLLHIVGALKHHFVYKDSTLLRILGINADGKLSETKKED